MPGAIPRRYWPGVRDYGRHLIGGETTEKQLAEALHTTQTDFKPLPGFDPNRDNAQYYRSQRGIDCDEVYPRVFIGDGYTAKNKTYLKRLGITHVLNAAEGKRPYGFVNTDADYYADTSIKYLGLHLEDSPSVNIAQHFYTVAAFIDDALNSGGKVYVHCLVGLSRSATCVLAFLMIKKGMLAADAIRLVRQSRDIHPNCGFLSQLAELDNHLRRI